MARTTRSSASRRSTSTARKASGSFVASKASSASTSKQRQRAGSQSSKTQAKKKQPKKVQQALKDSTRDVEDDQIQPGKSVPAHAEATPADAVDAIFEYALAHHWVPVIRAMLSADFQRFGDITAACNTQATRFSLHVIWEGMKTGNAYKAIRPFKSMFVDGAVSADPVDVYPSLVVWAVLHRLQEDRVSHNIGQLRDFVKFLLPVNGFTDEQSLESKVRRELDMLLALQPSARRAPADQLSRDHDWEGVKVQVFRLLEARASSLPQPKLASVLGLPTQQKPDIPHLFPSDLIAYIGSAELVRQWREGKHKSIKKHISHKQSMGFGNEIIRDVPEVADGCDVICQKHVAGIFKGGEGKKELLAYAEQVSGMAQEGDGEEAEGDGESDGEEVNGANVEGGYQEGQPGGNDENGSKTPTKQNLVGQPRDQKHLAVGEAEDLPIDEDASTERGRGSAASNTRSKTNISNTKTASSSSVRRKLAGDLESQSNIDQAELQQAIQNVRIAANKAKKVADPIENKALSNTSRRRLDEPQSGSRRVTRQSNQSLDETDDLFVDGDKGGAKVVGSKRSRSGKLSNSDSDKGENPGGATPGSEDAIEDSSDESTPKNVLKAKRYKPKQNLVTPAPAKSRKAGRPEGNDSLAAPARAKNGVAWTKDQEKLLISAVKKFGKSWAEIAKRTNIGKSGAQIKDKWRNLQKQGIV